MPKKSAAARQDPAQQRKKNNKILLVLLAWIVKGNFREFTKQLDKAFKNDHLDIDQCMTTAPGRRYHNFSLLRASVTLEQFAITRLLVERGANFALMTPLDSNPDHDKPLALLGYQWCLSKVGPESAAELLVIIDEWLQHPKTDLSLPLDRSHNTFLHHVAVWNPMGEAFCVLLQKHAVKLAPCVERVSEDGYTPLHWAAWFGRLRQVELLVTLGAELEAKTPCGKSALLVAADQGREQVLKYLLTQGADPHAVDATATSALVLAQSRGFDACVALLSQGAAISIADRNRLVEVCVAEGDLAALTKLFNDWKLDEVVACIDQLALVNITIAKGHQLLFEYLLGFPIDVNAFTGPCMPPIFTAIGTGNVRMMLALLAKQASPNQVFVPNQHAEAEGVALTGITPLVMAISEGRPECTELLLQHDADPMQIVSMPASQQPSPSYIFAATEDGHESLALLLTQSQEVRQAVAANDAILSMAVMSAAPDSALQLLLQHHAVVTQLFIYEAWKRQRLDQVSQYVFELQVPLSASVCVSLSACLTFTDQHWQYFSSHLAKVKISLSDVLFTAIAVKNKSLLEVLFKSHPDLFVEEHFLPAIGKPGFYSPFTVSEFAILVDSQALLEGVMATATVAMPTVGMRREPSQEQYPVCNETRAMTGRSFLQSVGFPPDQIEQLRSRSHSCASTVSDVGLFPPASRESEACTWLDGAVFSDELGRELVEGMDLPAYVMIAASCDVPAESLLAFTRLNKVSQSHGIKTLKPMDYRFTLRLASGFELADCCITDELKLHSSEERIACVRVKADGGRGPLLILGIRYLPNGLHTLADKQALQLSLAGSVVMVDLLGASVHCSRR